MATLGRLFPSHRRSSNGGGVILSIRSYVACVLNHRKKGRQKDWSSPAQGWKSFWKVPKEEQEPRRWRGGAQVIEDVFEDAQFLKRVDVKWQEWKEHWQVERPEQVMDGKP